MLIFSFLFSRRDTPFHVRFLVNLPTLLKLCVFLNAFNLTVFVGFVSLSVIHMEKGIVLLSVYTEDLTTQTVS